MDHIHCKLTRMNMCYLFVFADYLEPMSDEFFVLLVEKFANPDFQNLGVLLGIPENQNSNIFADTTFPNYQYKVLHVSDLSIFHEL